MRILPARSRAATAMIGVVRAVVQAAGRVPRRAIVAVRAAMIATSAAVTVAALRVREGAVQSREVSEVRVASGMIADFVTSATSVRRSRRRRAFPW